MGPAKIVLLTLLALGLAAAVGGTAMVLGGVYNVASTTQHTQFVYSVLEIAMRQAVRLRARDIEPPVDLDDPALRLRGALCFRDKCVQCHGAPGVAQDDIGKSMQPVPGPLISARQQWRPRELYWVTRHGIRMSGMPAWEYRLADEDLWAVVAFLQQLPELTPAQYAGLTARGAATTDAQPASPVRGAGRADAPAQGCSGPAAVSEAYAPMPVPSARRGLQALHQYACNACHLIPGVTGSGVFVGPPLAGIGRRELIAGRLPNTPANLVRWLRDPRSIDPETAMPAMGVTERDARDMAAYLRTLD